MVGALKSEAFRELVYRLRLHDEDRRLAAASSVTIPMPARRTLMGVMFGLALWAPSAFADSACVVTLTGGAKYRGELVESIPGDHLTIKLATGQVITFPWKDVVSNEEVELVAPVPSPPRGPVVHIEGPPSVRLERQTGMVAEVGFHWPARLANVYSPVCMAPCDVSVTPGEHRLAGPGYTPTSDFIIQGSKRLRLEPHLGLSSFRWLGLASTIAGGVLFIDGALFFALGEEGVGNNPHGFVIAGAVMAPVGAILLAVGVPLLVASMSSVKIREDARARVRLLSDRFAF
jgi:hypothetical protein